MPAAGVSCLALLLTSAAAPAAADPAGSAEPAGTTATVGALFAGELTGGHTCTASVLDSPSGDLVLTAAHCIAGTGLGYRFVPAYDDGAAPFGVWRVTGVWVDPAWTDHQDPRADVAVLRVADQTFPRGVFVSVQQVTGGERLGTAPPSGTHVTDVAYNSGIDDSPVSCTTTTRVQDGFPAFDCAGYVGGSSGSPWLATDPVTGGTEVRGVIGGPHQGGCLDSTSYSAPFGGAVAELVRAAASGLRPTGAPTPGGSGC